MTYLRRVALLLLMLTVPFQAALGATGALCAHGGVMRLQTDFQADSGHSGTAHTIAGHSHSAAGDVAGGFVAPDKSGSDNGAGDCDHCGECSFSGAPIPASSSRITYAGTAVEVPWYVDPAAVSRAGDDLFRPPRTAEF